MEQDTTVASSTTPLPSGWRRLASALVAIGTAFVILSADSCACDDDDAGDGPYPHYPDKWGSGWDDADTDDGPYPFYPDE